MKTQDAWPRAARWLILVLCLWTIGARAADQSKDKPADKPGDKGAKDEKPAKFPSPEVSEILKGWNGLDWGASLAQFKEKFPKAEKTPSGRWITNAGQEKLGGVSGTVRYSFNKKDELNLIVFEPVEADRTTLRDKLIDAGVLREQVRANWQNNGVTFILTESDVGQFVVVLHAKYADPKQGKDL